MNKKGILNLHYRKLLAERDIIINYIKILEQSGQKKLTLLDIQILCLLLTDLNNMDKELVSDKDLLPLKKYLECLKNDFNSENECSIDLLMQIIDLHSNKQISDDLNKSIAFNYAKLINQKELLLPVNYEVLEKAFK